MKELGIQGSIKRKYISTTNSKHLNSDVMKRIPNFIEDVYSNKLLHIHL